MIVYWTDSILHFATELKKTNKHFDNVFVEPYNAMCVNIYGREYIYV